MLDMNLLLKGIYPHAYLPTCLPAVCAGVYLHAFDRLH